MPGGPPPLAQRLVRALCFAGFAVALGSVLQMLQPFLSPDVRLSRFSLRNVETHLWFRLAELALTLAADGLLVVGLAGELFARAWARRLLNVYVGLMLGAWAFEPLSQFSFHQFLVRQYGASRALWGQLLVSSVGSLLSNMAFPVLLLACLRWPETRRAAHAGPAFAPVMPVPVEPPPATDAAAPPITRV